MVPIIVKVDDSNKTFYKELFLVVKIVTSYERKLKMNIEIKSFIEIILSIITVIVAIIAIFQTNNQIKISNKQFLFKNRLEKYILVNSLLGLFKDNKSLINYKNMKDNKPIIIDSYFVNLTNCEYLKDITDIIYDIKNNDKLNAFLLKLEKLRNAANEIEFLFKRKYGILLKNYIYSYQEILLELYKYQVFLNAISNEKIQRSEHISYEKFQKEFEESTFRNRLFNAISKLENCYNELNKNEIIKEIEKDIKL